jgi:hypothetical protein
MGGMGGTGTELRRKSRKPLLCGRELFSLVEKPAVGERASV